jgi:hypothetical protein
MHTSSAIPAHAETGTRGEAAAWVEQEVSPNDVVSCDLVTCEALRADGFPVGGLLVLSSSARDLLVSQVVVSTAPIRQLFGGSLGTRYAPAVLASFGSGRNRVDVRVVAPEGAGSYLSQLRADQQARQASGAVLLGSSRVSGAPQARKALTAGRVDSQLLIVLTNLASMHPVSILAFGDASPGASRGVPYRSVYLVRPPAGVMRQMLDFLRVQSPPFLASHMGMAKFDGRPAMYIEFAAPTPVGLFNNP